MARTNKRNKMAYLYAMEIAGEVKIGHTENVEKRRKALQTGNGHEVKVLGYKCVKANKAFAEEQRIHSLCEAYRLRNVPVKNKRGDEFFSMDVMDELFNVHKFIEGHPDAKIKNVIRNENVSEFRISSESRETLLEMNPFSTLIDEITDKLIGRNKTVDDLFGYNLSMAQTVPSINYSVAKSDPALKKDLKLIFDTMKSVYNNGDDVRSACYNIVSRYCTGIYNSASKILKSEGVMLKDGNWVVRSENNARKINMSFMAGIELALRMPNGIIFEAPLGIVKNKSALDLILSSMESTDYQNSEAALANEIARRINCLLNTFSMAITK